MLQSLGELDDWNAVLARVPTLAETEPDLWIFRGQARERAGDWAAAAAHYRQALKLNPNLLSAHYRLATIEGRLGHSAQAAAHRQRWQELHEVRSDAAPGLRRVLRCPAAPPQRQPRAAGVSQTTGLDLPDPRLVPYRRRLEPARGPLSGTAEECES